MVTAQGRSLAIGQKLKLTFLCDRPNPVPNVDKWIKRWDLGMEWMEWTEWTIRTRDALCDRARTHC